MGRGDYCHLTQAGWRHLNAALLDAALQNPKLSFSVGLSVTGIHEETGLHRATVRRIVVNSKETAKFECSSLTALCKLGGYHLQAEDVYCPDKLRGACTALRRAPAEFTQHSVPLTQEPLPAPYRGSGSLPATYNYLVRRPQEKEVGEFTASHRLVTLIGPGGVGKTRLAIQVAGEIGGGFLEGAKFVDLTALTDPAQVLWAVARALWISTTVDTASLDNLALAIGMRTFLLVIDKCEHLLKACQDLAALLIRECPNIKILATSHERLKIDAEYPYTVPRLSFPPSPFGHTLKPGEFKVSSENLVHDQSVELFCARARLVDPGFALTDWNAERVASICHQLEGMPLAIEMAASLKGGMPLEAIDAGLSDLFSLLPENYQNVDPKQLTLRAVMDWAYSHLTPDEKTLLNRLSVFASGWTPEAAARVCQGEDAPGPGLWKLLLALKNKSLLDYEEREGKARYRMLTIVRQYALQKLTSQSDPSDALSCMKEHQQFFLALAEQGEQEIRGSEQVYWLNVLYQEHENMCAALVSCGQVPEGEATRMRLVGALCRFWHETAYFSQGLEWCRLALQNAETFRTLEGRVKVLNGAGQLAANCAEYSAAENYFEQSLALLTHSHDQSGIAACRRGLGLLSYLHGDREKARAAWEESLAVSRNIQDTRGMAEVCNNLGALAVAESRFKEGEAYLSQSLSHYRSLNDRRRIADVQGNLGITYWQHKDMRALDELKENLETCRSIGYYHGSAYALARLGAIYLFRQELTQANAALTESLSIFEAVGDSYAAPLTLAHLGDVARAQGDLHAAQALYQKCLDGREKTGDRIGILHAHLWLGIVARLQRDYRRAQEHSALALSGFRGANDRNSLANVLNSLGLLALDQDDLSEAVACFKESLSLLRELSQEQGTRWEVGDLLDSFALLAAKRGSLSHSASHFEQSAQLWGAERTVRDAFHTGVSLQPSAASLAAMHFCRDSLGAGEWNVCWEAGRNRSLEQAIEYALQNSEEPNTVSSQTL